MLVRHDVAPSLVDVYEDGAVCLGPRVVCDGYVGHCPFRVQTHVHDDHMANFDRSKGLQDLFMSEQTRALLIAYQNADLEYRDNLIAVGLNARQLEDGSTLALLPSGHMLGSSQVVVELSDGRRCGYSGDFGWPLEDVIKVDELVVDSTYGSPRSVRQYTHGDAEACLLEVVCQRLRHGSVHIKAHRGTIERVLHVLGGNIGVPILGSERLIRELEVYREYGFAVGDVEALDSIVGQAATAERSYVRLYSKGDGYGNELNEGTTIECSAYMVPHDNPLLTFTDRAHRVALSNHADFEETLEFIAATGASRVVTDNTRTNGIELAMAINTRLSGVHARPSSNKPNRAWR